MRAFKISFQDESIVKLCASEEPTKIDDYTLEFDEHKIKFEVPIVEIDDDAIFMCE